MPIVKCDYCGKCVEKIGRDIKRYKAHFCNRACMGLYNNKKIIKKCDFCGKEIERPKSQFNTRGKSHNFCNNFCKSKYGQKKRQEKYPKIKKTVTCTCCGVKFEMFPCIIRRVEFLFCSKQCVYKFQKKAHVLKKDINRPYTYSRRVLAKVSNLTKITKEIENAKSKTTN